MRPFWYIVSGVALVVVAAVVFLALAGNRLPLLGQVNSRYLVGATDYLAVYVNNPAVLDDPTPPVVTLFGSTTVNLMVGDVYTEAGATSTDDQDSNLSITVFIDGSGSGIPLADVTLDTSAAGTHTLIYEATNHSGNTGSATRTVIVSAPANSGGGGTSGGGGSSGGGGGGGGGSVVSTPTTSPATVLPPSENACGKKGDFNHDGKVNIADFSILAYWYNRPLTAAALKECIDLNGDGKITLADFSILAYYWTN